MDKKKVVRNSWGETNFYGRTGFGNTMVRYLRKKFVSKECAMLRFSFSYFFKKFFLFLLVQIPIELSIHIFDSLEKWKMPYDPVPVSWNSFSLFSLGFVFGPGVEYTWNTWQKCFRRIYGNVKVLWQQWNWKHKQSRIEATSAACSRVEDFGSWLI